MKKFIFYAIKSVDQYCHTFSCRYHAGFSSFFRTNTVTNKLVSFGVLLLLLFSQTLTYGQLVGSSAVKGNFGIEGDVYANWLQFPNILDPNNPVPLTDANTDDWFVNTVLYPGTGRGVIDQSMPYPIIDNTSFERRQSITTPTAPFPYPVVPAVGPPWTGSYLWLDAVYGRDTYVKGGGAETSYFAGSGDKNSDNPSTWSIGLSGSVPQKDDIIDVYAHLRGEGIRIPDADPRPFTTLWAYAAASVAVTNGNKHIDFEFFRTEVTLANLGTPGSTGPNGGRTAWTFNPDGSVAIPGTIIISVDYTNGGSVPQVRIRVWMDETVFNNYNNLAPMSPFTVDKATAFEKGTDSGTYGYAAILENVGATDIWGRVNDTDPTQGPPWGTFAGVGPDGTPNYQELQFIEIGINLTAFGLDARGTQDPCSNILGSLMVKTRSSGGGPNEGAFGSELKDFAGPFLFGNTGNPPEPTVTNKNACENAATGSATVDLTVGANADGGTLRYYTTFTNNVYSGLIGTPAAFSAPIGVTTIYAQSESLSNPGCFGATSFTVTVTDNPDISSTPKTACESGTSGAATVDLTTGTVADGSTVTYHPTQADATNGTNAIANPASFSAPVGVTTIYMRGASIANTTCVGFNSFTVTVTDVPDISSTPKTACEGSNVNLTTGTVADGSTVTYHPTQLDATNGTNAIADPTSYGASLGVGVTTIYMRGVSIANTTCVGFSSFTLTITDVPDISSTPKTACEGSNVNLTTGTVADASTVTYHTTQADATNGTNAIADPTSYGASLGVGVTTIYMRGVSIANTTCIGFSSFTLTITDVPDISSTPKTACESGTSGAATVDLTTGTVADASTVSYHPTQLDATNGTNAIANPASFSAPVGVTTIYMRGVSIANTTCIGFSSFTVTVTDVPDISSTPKTACEIGTTGAATVNLTTGTVADGSTVSYHPTQLDATNGTNAIANPASFSASTGVTTIYMRGVSIANTTCIGFSSFTVTVTDGPDISSTPKTACESGTSGAATVDLTTGTVADGSTITYHPTQLDATNGTNAIANPASFSAPVGVTTIYMRGVAVGADCVGLNSFTVTVTDVPDISSTPKTACEGSNVNLTTGTVADGSTVTYHPTQLDATNGTNAIANPASYGASLGVGVTTIYMRGVSIANTTCIGFSSFTLTITDVPDISSTPKTACEGSNVNLTTGTVADGSTVTYHPTQLDATNGTNAIANPASYGASLGVGVTTIYMRGVSIANTTCIGFGSFTLTITDVPDISSTPKTTCETGTTGAATVDLTTGTVADASTVTYHPTQADATNGTNAIANPASFSASVGVTTIYLRGVSIANTTCVGFSSFTVTVNPNPELMIHNPETVCVGETVDLTAAAITSGSTLEGGSLSYWTDAAATIPLDTPSAVMVGTYYIKVLTEAGCMDIEPVMVTDQPCGGPLCTYTQGYYGNLGGMSCADGEQFTTLGLIEKALLSYGGTMQIGLPGHSVLISNTVEDKNAVIAVLPGGGSSYVLLAGDPHISALPSSYLKKGTINNTLLAQTITLGLNLGIDSNLGDFVLQSGTLATAAPEGGCGFDTPMPRTCSEEGYEPVINEYEYFTIPAVVDLLPNKTVQGLFDMANTALGGGALPEGVTLSALASAVDVINNAFDGCRISMGYEQTPLACLTSSPQEFVAFEVPIVNNVLTIKYKFSYVSDVTIDIFDAATGTKLFSKADTNSYLDKEVKLEYNFNTGTQKVYIVRLTTRLGHDEKKVISSY